MDNTSLIFLMSHGEAQLDKAGIVNINSSVACLILDPEFKLVIVIGYLFSHRSNVITNFSGNECSRVKKTLCHVAVIAEQ